MSDRSDGADGRSDQPPDDGDDDEEPTWVERLLVAASVIFTVVLFSFVLWQAATTTATAEPTATVTGTETLPSGDVKVTVIFRNAQDIGLVMATIEVDCDTPPARTHVRARSSGRSTSRIRNLSAGDYEPDRGSFDVDRGVASASSQREVAMASGS